MHTIIKRTDTDRSPEQESALAALPLNTGHLHVPMHPHSSELPWLETAIPKSTPDISIRVALADGHTLFRQALTPMLRSVDGISLVGETDAGPTAWAMISQLCPDVAILGTEILETSGFDLARRIVDAGFSTRLILLGESTDPAAFVDARDAGFAGYVLKKQHITDLFLAVRTVACGGSFADPSIHRALRHLERQGITPVALSAREREVSRFIALGKTGKEIARLLEISPSTVNTYRERLMEKLNAHTLADVVRYALRVGLIQ